MSNSRGALVAGLALLLATPGCLIANGSDDGVTPQPGDDCVVEHIVDGDTIDVDGCDDAGRVRLLLVDTPEVYPEMECFGHEATAYTSTALLGQALVLERDVRDVDQYGRKLRYAWLNGDLFNERIVADGYARQVTFPPDVKYLERVRQAEEDARLAGRGLWNPDRCPRTP